MANIVLAHGFLGFGENFWPVGENYIKYFNGVKAALEKHGHRVLVPSVSPLGSLDNRSQQLADAIVNWLGDSELSIIAHSMGGLDARRVIARYEAVGRRIKNLVAVATPHFGTPVADAFLNDTHVLYAHIPGWLRDVFKRDAGALHDLKTRTELHDPDRSSVHYKEVACVAQNVGHGSLLFELTRALGQLEGQNDGLVTLKSACCPPRSPSAVWLVDHGGAIGWPSDYMGISAFRAVFFPPAEHVARYVALAAQF
ncbi:esterase/lipase family protein [Azohydromonas lata]|uniref:esterase/lipase family protein n=1 Tax=Azohydromonas lata TaxID=45677 RepID=UPI001471D867|nr:alpha/beta fold hydrolase [Azohydromonas lata]